MSPFPVWQRHSPVRDFWRYTMLSLPTKKCSTFIAKTLHVGQLKLLRVAFKVMGVMWCRVWVHVMYKSTSVFMWVCVVTVGGCVVLERMCVSANAWRDGRGDDWLGWGVEMDWTRSTSILFWYAVFITDNYPILLKSKAGCENRPRGDSQRAMVSYHFHPRSTRWPGYAQIPDLPTTK